jgi:purine-binding chemotaxis protein CheW
MAETHALASSAWLIFRIEAQWYGLPVAQVLRIIEMVAMLELPGAPQGVQGIINVQGQIVPAIDLRRRWDLPPQVYTLRTPIILVGGENESQTLGLIVDSVAEVIEVRPEQLKRIEEVVPAESAGELAHQAPYLTGIARWGQQLGLLLRVEALLDPAEHAQLRAALKKELERNE